jgi:hypothetical protein
LARWVEAADTELDSTTAEEDEEEKEEEEEDKKEEEVWEIWDWDALDNETVAAAVAPDDRSMSVSEVSSSELDWAEGEEEESEDDPDMEVPSMGERSSMEFEEGEEEEEEEGEQEEKTEDEPTAVAPAHPAPAMEDDTGQDAALWGWVEPTWFKISVSLSGKVIVVDVSSRQTFRQVKFWIWVKERILPCQQRLFWERIEVDDTYWIVESCEVSLVLVSKVYAMYKVVISCPNLDYDSSYCGLREGECIQLVQRVIRVAIGMWPWAVDVGMFSDDELEELRVLLARHAAWELGIQAA